jgi:hypothetical protein
MKHLWKVLIAMAVMLVLVVIPATATANSYDKTLLLENKTGDPDWAVIVGDGISVTLSYKSSGYPTFDFSLTGKVPLASTAYSLIYYADPWPGNFPGALLGTGISNPDGTIAFTGSASLVGSLPSLPDTNICGDYCTKMCGTHLCNPVATTCSGAKIWLVPSANYDVGTKKVTGWSPTIVASILFEADLITFPPSTSTCLTTTIPFETMCISVTPNSLDFGTMSRGQCKELMGVLTVTNCGDVPITVTAVVSGTLYIGNLELSHGAGWTPVATWTTTLAVGASKNISTKLCIPLGFPAGVATGSLSFIASP